MTLYELTKKYGEGKGDATMWRAVQSVSDAIEGMMDESAKSKMMRSIYGGMSNYHYNEEYAKDDVEKMYYEDDNGNKHYAPYWTEQQVKEVYDKYKSEIPEEYNYWDFYVALQMQKSDLCPLLRRWFPNATDEQMQQKIVESTVNWLNDDDNPYGTHKVWGYVNFAK